MSSTSGAGITALHSSRGVAVGDLDNDGSEEVVVVNLFETPSLLKNFGARGNTLLVRAVTASGMDAIGARLTLTAGGMVADVRIVALAFGRFVCFVLRCSAVTVSGVYFTSACTCETPATSTLLEIKLPNSAFCATLATAEEFAVLSFT